MVWRLKFLEKLFFDASANPIAEEHAVGNDNRGAAWFRLALELARDELKEKQRGFGGLFVLGEVAVTLPIPLPRLEA